jgi:RHS repeat-associated protein
VLAPLSAPTRRSPRSTLWLTATATILVVGLAASPAMAESTLGSSAVGDTGGASTADAIVGAFSLGDGLEGLIDEADGALSVSAAVPGLALQWDSRRLGDDRYGFGAGWSVGLTHVATEGGIRVFPASGGVYEADASHPAGLAGYPTSAVRFDQIPDGELAARTDGVVGRTAFAFRMRELGGTTTYFTRDGDPVARVSASGQRIDWIWAEETPHRLERMVDESGVETQLSWDDGSATVEVTRGANLPGPHAVWRVERSDVGVTGLVDPEGERLALGYEHDLLTRVDDPGGSRTTVAWSSHDDGVLRVESLHTADERGIEVSVRTWGRTGVETDTGWPTIQTASGAGSASLSRGTELSDGQTTIRAEYGRSNTLTSKTMLASTESGERGLQAQVFTYPSEPDGETPSTAPNSTLPASTEVTSFDEQGRQRSAEEAVEYDDLGRVTSRLKSDGTRIEVEYDPVAPITDGPAVPPMGLPIRETTTTPDGLVSEVRHTLTEDGTRVTATESSGGRQGEALEPVGLVEYTAESDGFVTEERSYPGGDRAATPFVTRHTRAVDLARGVVTTTDTDAAGTALETTSSQVASLTHGGVLEQTDALGNTATAEYDLLGRAVTETAAGLTTTTEYDTWRADGRNAVTVTGPDGVETTEISDVLGRVTTVQDNIDDGTARPGYTRVAETRAYPAPGVVEVTDAWGATSSTEQDVFGRTVRTTAPGGLVAVTDHDDIAGTTTTGATPTGDLADAETTTTEHHDPTGRTAVTTGTRADGAAVPTSQAEFDGLGRPTTATDETLTTTWTYNTTGNPVTTTRTPATDDTLPASSSVTATRTFDASGRSLEKALSTSEATVSGGTRELDALGRTTRQRDQLGRDTTFDYTVDGLMTLSSQPGGRTTTLEYDSITRQLTTARVTDASGDEVATAYEHDPVTGASTAVFDPRDPKNTRIEYEYDAFGNTTRVTYPDGAVIEHEYDAHGRLEATTDVAQNTTEYRYTPDGLLAEATQQLSDGGTAHTAYSYDDHGRVTRLDRGNGSSTAYTYTAIGQVDTESTGHADGRRSERRYTYEPTGNLTTRTDTTTTTDGTKSATTTAYTYDAFDRLITSTIHDGDTTDSPVSSTTEYEPTVSGDLASEITTDANGRSTVRDYSYAPTGELTELTTTTTTTTTDDTAPTTVHTTQDYDDAGNLTRDLNDTTYTYDATGKRTASTTTDGTTTNTGYWADGTRQHHTTTTADGTTNRATFYWSGDTLINDSHTLDETSTHPDTATGPDTATATAAYLLGAGRHARTTPTGTVYYDTDRHGNTLTTTNEQGATVDTYTYTDYGTTTSTATTSTSTPGIDRNPYQYAGQYTDPDTSQPLGTRTYHPALRQFSTPDTEPLHNLRAYADLNPIMNLDPTGTTARPDEIYNWISFGISIIAGAISIAALAALPTGGAAIALYTVGAIGTAADTANLGITIAQLIKTYQPQWVSPHDTDNLNSDALTITSYTLTAAAAPAAATAILQRGASRLSDAQDAATEIYASAEHRIARQTARNLSRTKMNSPKFFYHATRREHAPAIARTGFDKKFNKNEVYGPGTYMARRIEATRYYGTTVFQIRPKLATAMKIDGFAGDLYRIRNPYWNKSMPKEQKYTSAPMTSEAIERYRIRHGIEAVYVKEIESRWEPILGYLRVPEPSPADGVLPQSRLRLLNPVERLILLAADLLKGRH